MDESVKELAGTINEFLLNLNIRIDDISNSYKNDGALENERVINLLEDLNALTEGISVVSAHYDNIDISELQEKLSLMTEALRLKDASLFIDAILYELKPLLEYWSSILT